MTTGPIAADVTCYPDFLEGQVLTNNDLNLLRDYLYSRWAFQNRCLFGFGVACGLDGTAGASLTIGSGFALAQDGRLLQMSTQTTVAWASIAGSAVKASDYGIGFLSGSGYTAVLVPADTKKAKDDTCDPETGCVAHTDQWCEAAQIVFAPGQLTGTGPAPGSALTVSPITVTSSTTVDANAFTALQKKLGDLLKPLVPADTLALLGAIALDPKQPGVNLMKVGLLNEVLFTLWDYERCRFYETGDCCGPGGAAAVALGWVDPGTKKWDCTYRHHFQLSTSLYLAIQGYRCKDLCQRYVDHVLDLIQNFQVPATPPDDDPGDDNPPPPHKCTFKDYASRKCGWWYPHERTPNPWPGYVAIDPTYQLPFIDKGDPSPVENPQFGGDVWEATETVTAIDPTNSGLIRLTDYIGFNADKTIDSLTGTVTGGFQKVDAAEFGKTGNIRSALVGAASDTFVFATNTAGAIVATGVVPTAQTLQQVPGLGVDVAEAKATAANAAKSAGDSAIAAQAAQQTAYQAAQDAAGAKNSFEGFQQQMQGSFATLEQKFSALPDLTVLTQAADIVKNWNDVQKDFQDTKQLAQANALELANQKGTLEQLRGQAEELASGHADVVVQVEQTRGTIAAQKEVLDRVEAKANDVGTQLQTTAAQIGSRVDQVGSRLDTQAVALSSGTDVRRAGNINATLTGALDALGAALVRAAPKEQQTAVQQMVQQAQSQIETLRSEGSGMPVTESHPELVANVMQSMVSAVEATGLNKHTNAYRDLSHSVDQLSLALGKQIAG